MGDLPLHGFNVNVHWGVGNCPVEISADEVRVFKLAHQDPHNNGTLYSVFNDRNPAQPWKLTLRHPKSSDGAVDVSIIPLVNIRGYINMGERIVHLHIKDPFGAVGGHKAFVANPCEPTKCALWGTW